MLPGIPLCLVSRWLVEEILVICELSVVRIRLVSTTMELGWHAGLPAKTISYKLLIYRIAKGKKPNMSL